MVVFFGYFQRENYKVLKFVCITSLSSKQAPAFFKRRPPISAAP